MTTDYTDFPSPFAEDDLAGFDLEHTGFDCLRELDAEWRDAGCPPDAKWRCPFTPGCGATKADECPERKRFLLIMHAPERLQ
jgi:hypothetical protein